MTDLTQAIIAKEGSIEILTTNQITFKHRGDKVILRGPLHAMVRMMRPNGKEKGSEEIILHGPAETKTVECLETPQDQFDVIITDMGPVPAQQTVLDLIVDRKHMDVVTSGAFAGYHQNDMIRLRGPAHYRVEFRGKSGAVRRAEDVSLNGPSDIRDFVNRSNEEDLYIVPAYTAPPAMPAPAAGGAFAANYPEGTLIKAQNSDTVYVLEGGAKRPLTYESFNKYGYKWDAIRTVPDHEVNSIPTGQPKL